MSFFSSPRSGARDIVAEIAAKQAAAKRKRNIARCTGGNSCDCPRCR